MPSNKCLPDRWLAYTNCGDRILSETVKTRFVCFKVPMKSDVGQTPETRFSPTHLIAFLGKKKHKLGLIIDLTFTTRYYDKQEFELLGIRHAKIMCEGQMIPRKIHSDSFAREVKKFMQEHADDDLLIGVHCTHGVNRSGYLVCRYMIDHMGVSPQDAIDLFNKCRGHNQERQSYIQHLLTNQLLPKEKAKYYKSSETVPRVGHHQLTNINPFNSYKGREAYPRTGYHSPQRGGRSGQPVRALNPSTASGGRYQFDPYLGNRNNYTSDHGRSSTCYDNHHYHSGSYAHAPRPYQNHNSSSNDWTQSGRYEKQLSSDRPNRGRSTRGRPTRGRSTRGRSVRGRSTRGNSDSGGYYRANNQTSVNFSRGAANHYGDSNTNDPRSSIHYGGKGSAEVSNHMNGSNWRTY